MPFESTEHALATGVDRVSPLPVRVFATWIRDEHGPMFCRWSAPVRPVVRPSGGEPAER